jgi:hypothetical protein
MSYRWLLLLCLLLPLSALAASVQASLDRNDAHLGETVKLDLRVDGSTDANTPDLSALDNDFEVLGSSTNSTLTLINGRPSAALIIEITLRPKHIGDLQIPSLAVAGGQTAPLILRVGAPDSSVSADPSKAIFIETTVSPDHVYTGQQLLYTVRLVFDVNLNLITQSGSLPDPHPDGTDVFKLGDDTGYEAVRNGRRYHVIERRYAMIPQHAGSLTIPSIEFQGEAADPNDSGGGLFGNTSPVTADSTPTTVTVQAVPADWGSTAWVPARALTLKPDGLSSNDNAQVGQPINLHMSVEAVGLPAEALPQLSLPAIDGATVYPDQTSDTTRDDGEWLTGHRERGFAIFPQHPGPLTIPAVTLTWFNVQTGQKQIATIPAHTLTVLAAPSTTHAAPAPAASSAVSAAAPAASGAAPSVVLTSSPGASSDPWRWIALGSIGLWALSAVAIWWWFRRKPARFEVPTSASIPSDSTRSSRHSFMEAARGKDRAAQARRLLAWARTERPGLQNLGQLSEALASEQQRAAIQQLQRLQYAGEATEDAVDLAAVFAEGFAWRKEAASGEDSPLPPLYPFKLD